MKNILFCGTPEFAINSLLTIYNHQNQYGYNLVGVVTIQDKISGRGNKLNESEVNAKDLCMMLLNEGLLCKETHKTVIRFAPPLMISKKEIDWAIKKITKVIRSV